MYKYFCKDPRRLRMILHNTRHDQTGINLLPLICSQIFLKFQTKQWNKQLPINEWNWSKLILRQITAFTCSRILQWSPLLRSHSPRIRLRGPRCEYRRFGLLDGWKLKQSPGGFHECPGRVKRARPAPASVRRGGRTDVGQLC